AITEPAPNYAEAPRVYAVGPAAPAAVLVLWPGDDNLARDPGLWTAQGFDVVMPQPADVYQLAADQQAALARPVSSAHGLAGAPAERAAPHRGVGGREEFTAGRKGAPPRGADQISALRVR